MNFIRPAPFFAAALVTGLASGVAAQHFQRLGTCPSLGCILPADQSDFLPGQLFDLRLEVHAPVNGSEAYNGGIPDEAFTFCISKDGGDCESASEFFKKEAPELEKWSFEWYEDLFAQDAGTPSVVNVASKIYRALHFKEPGNYVGYLKYYNGHETVANWHVREPSKKRQAKNVILFIGDGMAPAMITAARLLGHKSINGKYQSLLAMDTMEALGHQMTHSIDSFITDSANSASSLNAGIKATVNGLNVQRDSSENSFDDPKRETYAEMFKRLHPNGSVGIVTTAAVTDATPAAVCAHTTDRYAYQGILQTILHGSHSVNSTFEWPSFCSPDVLFGGGAEFFLPGEDFESPNHEDYYQAFKDAGYQVVKDNSTLASVDVNQKALGIFSVDHMPVWLDRNVYTETLKGRKNSPTGDESDALDLPGLKEMTLKAVDILQTRSEANGGEGFVLMSEAASVDKQMHKLDYDRALGDLLELDNTVRATLEHLKKLGIDDETLVVVTADHGHGFDVFGAVDTKYLNEQTDDRMKRAAVGTYQNSGLSGYQVAGENPINNTIVYGEQGPGFPVRWDPRYTTASGFGAMPDHREGYQVNQTSPRKAVVEIPEDSGDYYANPEDQPNGFLVNGTLPTSSDSGVHSLTDVAVFASGPGSELFRGVYNNVDIFYKIADALGLGCQ